MSQEDLLLAPESLEALTAGLADVATALGPQAAAGIEGVRMRLERAATARADGRRDEAVAEVLGAMQALAQLAATLGPDEAGAMQALAGAFQSAMRQGDVGHAVESVDTMRVKSGAVKKRGDEFKL